MHIDKFKDKDGTGYIDKDGCYHENAIDFITNAFGFCGCGFTDDALEYIRKALQLVDDLNELVRKDKILSYKEWEKRCGEVFMSQGAEYFTWYVLDKYELIEHGMSVPGWLTESGRMILSDLNELELDYHENKS